MAWWIRPLEVADERGRPTGRWRLTAKSDEDGGGAHRLCECEPAHASPVAARGCPEAQERARSYS